MDRFGNKRWWLNGKRFVGSAIYKATKNPKRLWWRGFGLLLRDAIILSKRCMLIQTQIKHLDFAWQKLCSHETKISAIEEWLLDKVRKKRSFYHIRFNDEYFVTQYDGNVTWLQQFVAWESNQMALVEITQHNYQASS